MISPGIFRQTTRKYYDAGCPNLGWILITLATAAGVIFTIHAEEGRELERIAQNKERGITMQPQERIIKYSKSGVKYFMECMEGRNYIIISPDTNNQALAGPINNEEC